MKFDIYKMAEKYKLSDTERQLLEYLLNHSEEVLNLGVREVATQNYTSAATVIKLSKKLGFTGYVDMVYRLHFLIKNQRNNRNLTSDITSFIMDMDDERLELALELFRVHRDDIIYITATGFSSPLADYFCRKMLVLGYKCIQTNAYGVYDTNQIGGKLVIAISKSGETDSITKVIDYARHQGIDILSFTGEQANHISKMSTVNLPILDDKALDDRNLTANYFYARVIILFEHMMSQLFEGEIM